MAEANMEQPSTSLQRDFPIPRRKGKELKRDEIDEEPMSQLQVAQIPPAAKRHKTKRKTPIATEATLATIQNVYVRRTCSRTQKAHPTGDSTEVTVENLEKGSPTNIEMQEKGSPVDDEIQVEVDEDRLENLSFVAQQLEETIGNISQ